MIRSPLKRKRDTPRRNEGRTVHERMKPRAKAAPTKIERFHLDRIAAMGCVVTGAPAVVHHVMHMPGKRRRRDHRYVVPLSPELHNMGDASVHSLGSEEAFRLLHQIDLVEWATTQWKISCSEFAPAEPK